jgi:glutathione S-transferase
MLRLYFHPRSTYGRRVRVAMLEKGIEFEPVELDMAGRAHKAPEYLAKNPYGRVPTLEHDGFVLYESAAILWYLEATHPSPALAPADARGRAEVDMHLRLCDGQLGRYAGVVLFPKRFLPPERWDRPAIDAARAEIEKHLAIVEQQLGHREYLVGDAFTLADVAYLPFLHFLELFDVPTGPRVQAWRTRLLARPSAQATVPAV